MRLSRVLILQILLKVSAQECNRSNNKCCYNEYFDNNTNQCVVCRNGSIRWNCETLCTAGYYGYLCQTPCECVNHLCDKQTGCQPRQSKTSTTQDRNKPAFSKKNAQETSNQIVNIETYDRKWNISETPASSDGSEGRIQDSMPSAILFFIGSITTVFIGGAFIYFRKRFLGIFINRYKEEHTQ